ncbi:ethylmalonyl-CoA decarboxylase-like [Oppia nitens]|uniref:ethylmalonyl-CoA decarboxylase-like n=1 Tax=Oppia nitens TaxID=1686743 RepID=UPI0023DB9F8B|nr:ethylmalonyl-CoA decarboxylase-like [Oppia nitens]
MLCQTPLLSSIRVLRVLPSRTLATFTTFTAESVETCCEPSVRQIRDEFMRFGGGSVELRLNNATGVARIELRNFGRKNAFSGRMMSEFADTLDSLSNWSQGKAVVIHGSNGFFSSGGDLETVRQIANPFGGRKMSLLMHDNLTRLQCLPLVSVSLIDGMAIGGGAEVASSTDFRLMTPNARFGFVHVRLGIVSAWGGGQRLVEIVGQKTALDLMLTAKQIDPKEALRLGLCDAIVDEEDAIEAAVKWTQNKVMVTQDCVRAVKQVVNAGKHRNRDSALKHELEESVQLWGSTDHLKALKANIKHK